MHEINALLDLKNENGNNDNLILKNDDVELDSIENSVAQKRSCHPYENVEISDTGSNEFDDDPCERVNVKDLTNKFENKEQLYFENYIPRGKSSKDVKILGEDSKVYGSQTEKTWKDDKSPCGLEFEKKFEIDVKNDNTINDTKDFYAFQEHLVDEQVEIKLGETQNDMQGGHDYRQTVPISSKNEEYFPKTLPDIDQIESQHFQNDFTDMIAKMEIKTDEGISNTKSDNNQNTNEKKTYLNFENSMLKSKDLLDKRRNSFAEGTPLQTFSGRNEAKVKIYEKDSLPPCIRARNLKYSAKNTSRSLDDQEFHKECGVNPRRKSLESEAFRMPKILNVPKTLPVHSVNNTNPSSTIETEKLCIANEQNLNRERIEKYKEERRKILHEKYRSESFKEDKDVLMLRLKLKPREEETGKRRNSENEHKQQEQQEMDSLSSDSLEIGHSSENDKSPRTSPKLVTESLKSRAAKFEPIGIQSGRSKSFIATNKVAPTDVRCATTRKLLDDSFDDFIGAKDSGIEEDFVRGRRRNDDVLRSERRRHTYESRERELEDNRRLRRTSLEAKSPR